MLETEERLFDEYKRVDNICRDMLSSQSGIKQYITEMGLNSFRGRSVVTSWDRDYRWLQRVQGLRNKIAHETSATDCNEEDLVWLEEFHNRLLERQDPLALLGKADRERSNLPPRRENVSNTVSEQWVDRNAHFQEKKASPLKRAIIVLVKVLIILFVAALLLNTAMDMI
ncbi:MAG: hypothetical protein K2J11_09830 [Oscillospiraceae bacterium]|nr:hypothetical protein [Oscillospiraceae bacterium]